MGIARLGAVFDVVGDGPVEFGDQDQHFLRGGRIKVAGRLVRKDQLRIGHDRPRDGRALASGKLPGQMVRTVAKPIQPRRVEA